MLKKIQVILLYLIFFLLPFNSRYIFNFSNIKHIQSFKGQLEVSFFLFDIFNILLLLISLWVYRKKFNKVLLGKIIKHPLFYFIIFVILSFWTTKNSFVDWYNLFRLLSAISLFLIAQDLLKQYTVLTYARFILFIDGVLQAIIALVQFITQKSIGFGWLGESVIGKNILGVAKFSFEGEKYIRAYGTFPHPNVLGIFLLFSLSAGLSLLLAKKGLFKNIRPRYRFIFYLELLLILLGIILTYSRTTITLTGLVLLIFAFKQRRWINATYKNYCHKLHIPFFLQTTLAILLVFGTVFVTYNLLTPRLCLRCAGDNSWQLRQEYQKNAQTIICQHPLFGVGLGKFTSASSKITDYGQRPWELQPVHNLYLLIAAETGLLGLISFLATIVFYLVKKINLRSLADYPLNLFFLSLLLIAFFDHYFWTLPQGQLIFWLALALATVPKTKKIDSPKYHFEGLLKNVRYLIRELS